MIKTRYLTRSGQEATVLEEILEYYHGHVKVGDHYIWTYWNKKTLDAYPAYSEFDLVEQIRPEPY